MAICDGASLRMVMCKSKTEIGFVFPLQPSFHPTACIKSFVSISYMYCISVYSLLIGNYFLNSRVILNWGRFALFQATISIGKLVNPTAGVPRDPKFSLGAKSYQDEVIFRTFNSFSFW